MNRPRICLLGSLEEKLRSYLTSHPEGHERAAVVLFRRFHSEHPDLSSSDRYVAVEVHPFEDACYIGSSEIHYEFLLHPLRQYYQRCEEEGLVFCIAHNHPQGMASFSSLDEENEQTLLRGLTNRNGKNLHFIALLLCDGHWHGRVRHGLNPTQPIEARYIAVLGERLELHGIPYSGKSDNEFSARQAAAFGQPFVARLKSLRVAVIGNSGTGGPAVTMLARSGVSDILCIDHDKLAESNLNRVRGSRKIDVGKNKAEISRDFIHSIGLDARVVAMDAMIDISPDAIDAVSTCDVVFGCTDDDLGRQALNAAVSFYGVAYIDVGIGGKIGKDIDGLPVMTHQHGRVSLMLPEFGTCLFCQLVTTEHEAKIQQAKRDNPNITEDELRERYLDGGREPSPGVGPFTSIIAEFGVATLYDLIRPYRRLPGDITREYFFIDFISLKTSSRTFPKDGNCPYCGTREYLLSNHPMRLRRPGLGRRNVYV